MNILVPGGTGLIGSAMCEAFVRDGHQVWVLTRNPRNGSLPTGVQAVQWDGKTTQGWGELVSRMDAVINLAGENIGALPWTNERKRRIRTSRVEAGRALVEAISATDNRPRVLIQSSGSGYYGPSGDGELTESSPHGRDYQSGVAMDWEASTQPVEALGVRRVVTRSGVVLTNAGGILDRFSYQVGLYLGGPLGSGRQWVPWIHIQDEINAVRFLIEQEDATGPFNLVAPEAVTNAQFERTLAEVMGRPSWLPVPGFALKALLGEMSTLVLDGQRVVPEKLLAAGFQFKYPQLKAALQDLL